MKNKLLALTLALFMLCSAIPAGAVGMIGVETADEISEIIPEAEQTAKTMASLEDGVILMEDFESTAAGTTFTEYNSEGKITKWSEMDVTSIATPLTGAKLFRGDQAAAVSVEEIDGNNVLKVGAVDNFSDLYRMVTLKLATGDSVGLTAENNPGKYTLSYKYYLASDDVSEKHLVTIFFEANKSWCGGTTNVTHGTWLDYSVEFEITADGYLKCGSTLVQFTGSIMNLQMTTEYTASAANVCYYLDDIKLTYEPASTVLLTYVDKSGNTLYTSLVNKNTEIELAGETELGFNPLYEIDGKVYMNSTYTPTENTTIVVSETNILFLETFESYTAGQTLHREGTDSNKVLPPIWFGVTPAYMVEGYKAEIANTDCYEKTIDGTTYRTNESLNVAEYDGNKYAVLKGYRALNNNTGFFIKGLNLSNPGTYKLSMNVNVRQGTGGTWNQTKGNLVNPGNVGNGRLTAATENEFVYFENVFEVSEKDGTYTINASHNLSSNINTATLTTAITDGVLCIYFGAAEGDGSQPVEVYFDNVMLTYEEPIIINASYVDKNGNPFDYADTQKVMYILPTAEDLGLAYEPKFTDANGNEYYPGTVFYGNGDVEFTVSKSNVILFEDFETIGSGYSAPKYARGGLAGATIYGTSATDAPNGTRAYKTGNIASKKNDTPNFLQNFDFSAPGIYKFYVDVELKVVKNAVTDLVDDGFYANIQIIPGWRGMSSSVVLTEASPKGTLEGTLYVYEKEGALYYSATGQENPYTTITDAADKWIRVGYVHSKAFQNSTATKAEHYAYADNFTVTYEPYAPTTVKLAGYRAENENETGGPAGIRFASYISANQKSKATEFGYVVTRKTLITTDGTADYTKLNLDGIDAVSYDTTTSGTNRNGVKVVAKASYNGTNERIYAQEGSFLTAL